jgi:tRNA A-37 threonylcarbamoyl transferase component Bud32
MLDNDPLWHQHLTGCEVVKESKSKRLLRCPVDGTGKFRLVKIYYYPGPWQALKYLFRPSKASRELDLAVRIREKGIPTIVPEQIRDVRKRGLLKESAVLAEYLPEAMNLEELLIRKRGADSRLKRRIIREYGKLARLIHDRGVYQDDFDPNNILFQKKPGDAFQLYLLDFERTRIIRAFSFRRRIHSLAKLNRMGRNLPPADQMRFLKAYLGQRATRQDVRRWVTAIRREEEKVRRRDQRRARRECTSENSRIGFFRHEGYQGYYRKRHHSRQWYSGSDMIGLARALERSFPGDAAPRPSDHPAPDIEVPLDTGTEAFRVQVFEDGGMTYRLRRFLKMTPLLEAWKADNGHLKNRSAAFMPVAALEKGTGPGRWRGFLVRKNL